jgi:hypothetical protein
MSLLNILMRSKKVLIALFLVFLAPGVLAIIFYLNPSWLGGLPTNKGLMIRPSVKLACLNSNLNSNSNEEKWHMAVWCPKGCDTGCLQTLDEMARVRLALGRRLYQVDLWVLQGQTGVMCKQDIANALKAQDVKTRVLTRDEQAAVSLLQNQPKVFLADPDHYLVLEYEALGKASDVFQDLKRLLNTREQA